MQGTTMNSAAPRQKVSRTLAVYASLWLLAESTGSRTNGTLLLSTIFGVLTLTSVGRFIVTETIARRGRLNYPQALNLAAWFVWVSAFALAPFWLNLLVLFAASPSP